MIDDGTAQLWPLFAARSGATPDKLAAVDETGRSLTWGAVADQVDTFSQALHALGVGAGSTVSWQLPTILDAMVLSLALSRLGAIQNPIIPMYRARELRSVLGEVQPSIVFVERASPDDASVGLITEAFDDSEPSDWPRIVGLDALQQGGPTLPAPSPIEAGQRGWYCYTSGSTSRPKGAIHADLAVLTAGRSMAAALSFDEHDRYAIVFPFAHVGGMSNVVASMVSGMTLFFNRRFDAEVTIPALREWGITVAGAGPPFFMAYLEAQRRMPEGEAVFPKIRAYVGGGAPTPPRLHRAFAETVRPAPIVLAYGLTEAPIITSTTPDDPFTTRESTVGRVWNGAEVRIIDGEGNDAGIDRDGEVLVRGPQLLLGYMDESLNDGALVDGWFHTGDLGRLDAEGNLSIVGRIKDVIIRNMENIAPSEVEDVLMHHQYIREVAVIGLPDERCGERVCAVVVLRDGATLTLRELAQWAREQGVAGPKIPEQLEIVDELPVIGFGKFDKKTLKDRFSARAVR